MDLDFSAFLIQAGDLSESVVLSLELDSLFREARLLIDRVVDATTGVLIDDLDQRVIEVQMDRCREVRLDNRLGESMWGPEAKWGLNEVLQIGARQTESGWKVKLRWSQEIRSMTFLCEELRWRYVARPDAEVALRRFYGEDDGR